MRPTPLASTPCELGPTRRRLCARARVSSSWRRSSLPLPEKPDEMTTAAPAPLAAASRSTSATPSAGTATTTRSTGASRSARLRTVGTPSMTSASGCTTCRIPAYAEPRIASRTPCPKPPADRRTPTTATLAGCSSGRRDRAAARHSRWSAASTASREASVRSSTSTSPATVRAGGAEPGCAEDAEHAVVVTEDLRLEAADPVLPAERGEVLEEQAAQAPAPVLVGDQERDLGGVGGEQLGGRQTGDPATHDRHQGRRRGVVGSEEVVDVAPTRLPAGGEEPQSKRVDGHRLVQPQHGLAVVLAQRPDHRHGPVGEQHVRRLRAPVPGGEGRSRLVGHVPNVPERAATCQRPGPPIRGVPRHG